MKEKHLVTGTNRQRLTKGLYWDFSYDVPSRRHLALFTVQDCRPSYFIIRDGVPRYDLRQLYLLVNDHTEYEFVKRFMWDEKHWEKVSNAPLVKPYVETWRKELKAKVRSEMVSVLIGDALDPDSKTKTSSAKYLLDKFADPKTPASSRKTKDKTEDLKLLNEQNQEDWLRVKEMINVN